MRIKGPPLPTLRAMERKVKQKGHRADALALQSIRRKMGLAAKSVWEGTNIP